MNRYLERLSGLLDHHVGLTMVHAWIAFATGRFHEAERALASVTRLGTDEIDPGLIQALRAMIHLADGDVASALMVVDEEPGPTTEPTNPMTRGGARVMGGRFDEAQPFLERANEMAASHPDHFVAAITPIFEAIAAIESGRPRTANKLARSAVAIADGYGLAEAAQMALAYSVITRTTTDADEAIRAARHGAELAGRSPEKVMLHAVSSAADVAFVYGHDDAAELLVEARTVANRCVDAGIAGRYLGQVEARHGRTERPVLAGLVEEISERELSVLRYLPSQLSQREIASELFVSVNTVKSHCRAIYRKLGVDGRQSAVQAARDHGLL